MNTISNSKKYRGMLNRVSAMTVGILCVYCSFLSAQTLSREDIKEAAKSNFHASIEMYRDFLKIPNNGNYQEHMQRNATWCAAIFEKLGFDTKRLVSKGVPHVFAEKIYNEKYKTVLFYMQIDGQPVDTSRWNQSSPYVPVLKKRDGKNWKIVDWDILRKKYDDDLRIFARSASDSKGPSAAFITALKILTKIGKKPTFNIKVIMDFQEELGSPTLTSLVKAQSSLFKADMLLIMDGTRHLSNLPTLTFGARGISTVTLKVFGSSRDLHSGQYGNFAPNPVFKLADLLSDMKDENGRVVIPGFYDGVFLTEKDKRVMNTLPEDLSKIKKSLGIATIDSVGTTYQEALQYPSLNVRGLNAAWVGKEVRTLIPSYAIAEIDMRLVPETPGERQVQLLKEYILSKGYRLVDSIPSDEEREMYSKLISMNYKIGSKPFRTEINSDIGRWLSTAMERIFDKQYVKMRTTGGSQPMAPFINMLGIPAVSIRIPNPDNNIHAPNENLRVGNYLEGIETCLTILNQPIE